LRRGFIANCCESWRGAASCEWNPNAVRIRRRSEFAESRFPRREFTQIYAYARFGGAPCDNDPPPAIASIRFVPLCARAKLGHFAALFLPMLQLRIAQACKIHCL